MKKLLLTGLLVVSCSHVQYYVPGLDQNVPQDSTCVRHIVVDMRSHRAYNVDSPGCAGLETETYWSDDAGILNVETTGAALSAYGVGE